MEIKSINVLEQGLAKTLGALEFTILSVLWDSRDSLSSREITNRLEDKKKVSVNAVTTVLNRLEQKDLVIREANGKRYFFKAAMSKKAYARHVIKKGLSTILEDKSLLSAAGITGELVDELDHEALDLLKGFLDEDL